MKTLVVLSALAAVALAAPALLEDGAENIKETFTNIPGILKRERKSPLESSQPDSLSLGAPAKLTSKSQISEIGVSGRSFGLKKPIIIKKKPIGYRVYRNSEEELAESGETCGKQVKVKFCDVKSEDKLKSSTIEDIDTQMTEEDMKNNIKLAKEAVENLQRDLKVVELKPGTQEGSWHNAHSASDAELHQDIEVAREALEHIHKNFGNLESMSLHATTLKNADTVDHTQFTIAKTEEQRLAQWKEAIDTIQKNVEIAKNIEDSFRSASGEAGLLFTDDSMTDANKHELNKITDEMRTTKDLVTKDENKADSESCKVNHADVKSSENNMGNPELTEDDMASSASTMSERKMEHGHNNQKEADGDTIALQDLFLKSSALPDSVKPIEEIKEKNTDPEQTDKKLALADSFDSVPESTNKMKTVESEDMLLENQRHSTDEVQSDESLKHNDHMEKMETGDHQFSEMKSAEHFDEQFSSINHKEDKTQNKDLHTEQAKEVDTQMFPKSAEEVLINTPKEENMVPKDNFEQHVTEVKMATHEDLKQRSEISAPINNVEPIQFHQQSLTHPEMRAVEELNNKHQIQLPDSTQTRWAEDKNFHLQMESMKSADGVHSQTMDHVHRVQLPGSHPQHHLAHGMKNHHFETASSHEQLHSRFPDNFMTQGKSADVDMPSYYMSMRDGSGLRPENSRFRWNPNQETSRNAYGAPAAPVAVSPSSGGAVGVFPNTNVGSCGIPLLLSCNPSVVSGSLAKTRPAPYTAPAYRTEDDFNFHRKRDVKKTHEKLPSILNRTPNVNTRTSTVLVAKQ